MILRVRQQSIMHQNASIPYLFAGLHMTFCDVNFFLTNLQAMVEMLVKETEQHPEKQVIVRSTLPQHFDANDSSGTHNRARENSHCANVSTTMSHWTNYYLEDISRKNGFKFLDSSPIYMDRWDLHFPENEKLDCTHFCYTPDLYMPEIVLLNKLLG